MLDAMVFLENFDEPYEVVRGLSEVNVGDVHPSW